MNKLVEYIDVAVIGAGHAGCEASLAAARLGLETMVFTVSVDSIAMMPCNPNIGGSSKGHLVKEIDALGGEMGKVIDKTFIQSKMLNKSKGPAVHSLRAQADKKNYSNTMRQVLENTPHLTIKQAEVTELIVEDGTIKGVKTYSGATYYAKAVVRWKWKKYPVEPLLPVGWLPPGWKHLHLQQRLPCFQKRSFHLQLPSNLKNCCLLICSSVPVFPYPLYLLGCSHCTVPGPR